MARRRPSFATYARRRWRVIGLLLVLLAGSVLILAVTDRGHDPQWTARGASMEQGAISPSGDAVYALIREHGNVTRLDARRGGDGHLLWQSSLNATRALIAAGDDGVAIATDFPLAFLTVYQPNLTIRFQTPLEGVPRALAVDGDLVALALQAPDNPVLVFDRGTLVAQHRFSSFVNAIDLRAGRLAAGTGNGEVRIDVARNASRLYESSLPVSVRSVRLSEDATALMVGGASLSEGDLSGAAAFVDLLSEEPLRWTRPTTSAVGFVDLDASGVRAIAVEQAPPNDVLHAYEAYTGDERWGRVIQGGLAQADGGGAGGVSMSADGQRVAVGTLHGGITVYAMSDGTPLWTFRDAGATLVTWAQRSGDVFLANGRLNAAAEDPGLFLFSATSEPFAGRLGALSAIASGVLAAIGAGVLGFGYWRVRRSY